MLETMPPVRPACGKINKETNGWSCSKPITTTNDWIEFGKVGPSCVSPRSWYYHNCQMCMQIATGDDYTHFEGSVHGSV